MVDYLQPGHDAITRWGLLRGPGYDFQRRQRYYGLLQILPYLQPGARVLPERQEGGNALTSMAVRTADGVPAIFLVNQDFASQNLTLNLTGSDASAYATMDVTRTERSRQAEHVGRLRLQNGVGQLTLPPRSITTLLPAGSGPPVDDSD